MTRTRIAALAAVVVLATAAVLARDRVRAWWRPPPDAAAPTVEVAGWRVAVTLAPDPPREQGQAVVVALADGAGAPIDGAALEVTADMPAMGAMAEMKASAAAAATGPGRYAATLELPMGGSWGLAITARARGACAIARFKLTIGQPGVRTDGGGACAEAGAPTIHIDEARQRALGITTAPTTRGPLALELRAVGRVTYDESRLADVVLKVGGFVSGLRVRATGQAVRAGEPLFLLYSPELFAAQQDFLVARASTELMGSAGRAAGLVRAAEKKLELLGLTRAQIDEVAARGEPIEKLPFTAPAAGAIIEKNVVDGDAVTAGQRLFRIAALDRLWVEADLYEPDLAHVAPGAAATVEIGAAGAAPIPATVAFVYPYLDPQTRTGRVRLELANARRDLRPDAYATVTFHVPLGDRLTVPTAAIVYTGPRRLVFVELGGGALRAQEVTLGARTADRAEITAGLAEGDVVVTSGNFLVAAESRLRAPEGAP